MNKLYKALSSLALMLLCSFLQQCTQNAPTPSSPSTAAILKEAMNSAQEGLTHEEILKRAWTKAISDGVDAELIRIPTKVSETASAKSGENQPPTSSLLQVCYDYYMVYYTNGVETGRDFLYRDCYTVDDNGGGGGGSGGGGTGDTGGGGSGGGGGTGNNCRGCGDVGVVMTALQQLTPDDFYPQNGVKPLGEFPDRCAGTQGLWNLGVTNGNAETFGYLTADGKVIATATLGPTGGGSSGLVSMLSPTGGTLYFYTYPASQGVPTQAYTGMKTVTNSYGTQIYIPVVASIHTHTPCLTDGTDGVTNHQLSGDDQNLANDKQGITHYIIGCNAIGSFSAGDTYPTVLGTGSLSVICSFAQ